ncbi:hypothetical protein BO94DRAFT_535177 [Aspergillus sclerotioniger CBS 115572]|uniref:Uncharacterized protein n=1 Tax=Aspergillus sclerotioniger CBS 115572 TaxID=1450535 RepID=A0A317WMV9_9EURO|nr:hypothetical protein BO94DRAFT_535177 [Aspergillus sclerotioniger CBS 115572]PWY87061.1 hypothetical protein BO94DRAFT_535177 [Aspergillus sclerotioniger CBS 115572]
MDVSTEPARRYTRSPHCLLCGERFTPDTHFRSVVLSKTDQHPVLTRSISFRGKGGIIHLQDLNVEIHSNPRLKSANAFSVHSLCWAALVGQPSVHKLYDLGRAMTPLTWTGLPQSLYNNRLVLSKSIYRLDAEIRQNNDEDNTLWRLLQRCGSLPTELVAIIWGLIDPSPVRCLLALWAADGYWTKSSSAPNSGSVYLVGNIFIYFTRVLDGTYICGIRQRDILYGHESKNSVEVSAPVSMEGLTFSLGPYGLRSIRFLSDTGTHHKSIGGAATMDTEFIGVIYPQPGAPLQLNIEWDALKIARISCPNNLEFGHNFLWETQLPWTEIYPPSERSFYDWPRHWDFTINPQRFMAYIPLHRDGFHLYGLTAFCSSKGLIGLGTHFRSRSHSTTSYWYGNQKGCLVHAQFGPSETVSLISVYWHPYDRLSKPYFAITTNKKRTLFLGPCFTSVEVGSKNIYDARDGGLMGLYYDKSLGISGFTSLGTVCRRLRDSSVKQIPDRSIPQTPQHSNTMNLSSTSIFEGFTSKASLINIQTLKACYIGPRCKGMLLIYDDDTRCILGQWYEGTSSQPDDIRELYFESNDVLRFYFMQNNGNQILNRIETSPQVSSPEESELFVDFKYGDDIIWLFSEYTDTIFGG